MVEYADGHELPDTFLSTDLHRRLVDCAADVTAWTNDLFSAPKELSQGERCNLVAVLAHHQGISVQDAALLTVDWITGRAQEFLAARAALLSKADQDSAAGHALPGWADSLGRWAGGNLGFCLASDRYPSQCARRSRLPR